MQIIPFLLASLTSLLFDIQKLTLFDHSYPILHNKLFPYQHNFTKNCAKSWQTAYFQTPDFTPALKFYTSSARDANDIFHVWGRAKTI